MKSLFFLGLFLPFLKASSLSCYSAGVSVDLSFDTTSLYFSSSAETATCDVGDACGIAQYDIDITVTTNSTEFWVVLFEDLFGKSISTSYTLKYETCVDNDTCTLITGSSNKCREAKFNFASWIPTSCDEGNGYGAIVYTHNTTYDYGCCTSDDCNGDSYSFSSCETEEFFTTYIGDLNGCWDDEKKDFMKYLYCGDGKDIYDSVASCYASGSYDWSNTTCRYRLTCNDELQKLLTDFGDCACDAAKKNGYSGVLLSDFLETQWQSYCPSINLTCSNSGSLDASMTYYYVYYTFSLKLAHDSITDDIQLAIVDAIADATYCNSTVVDVSSIVSINSTDTKVTITFTTQSSTDQATVETKVKSSGGTAVATATGATVSGESTTTSTGSVAASKDTSAGSQFGLNIQFSFLILLVCVCSLF